MITTFRAFATSVRELKRKVGGRNKSFAAQVGTYC